MLPTLTTTKDSSGRWTYALDHSSILDPLVRAIATERAGNEEIDRELDEIADLVQTVDAAPDADAADAPGAELSWRVDQLVDSLGLGRYTFPAEPNSWDIGHARLAAQNLHAMADALTAWAERNDPRRAAA
nr:hypothetical protein KPHV_29030 [Kitasatospora purpeofusca]